MEPFGRVFFKISLINLRFAQKRYSVFVQYNESHITPSTCPHWEREKTNPNQESFLLLSLCTYSAHCFCTILCLEKRPSLIWTKRSLLGGVFQKFFDKSAFCTKARLCFCAMFYCVGFLKYHQTANTVTLNKSENAVDNIITLLRAFCRSEGAYKAAREP